MQQQRLKGENTAKHASKTVVGSMLQRVACGVLCVTLVVGVSFSPRAAYAVLDTKTAITQTVQSVNETQTEYTQSETQQQNEQNTTENVCSEENEKRTGEPEADDDSTAGEHVDSDESNEAGDAANKGEDSNIAEEGKTDKADEEGEASTDTSNELSNSEREKGDTQLTKDNANKSLTLKVSENESKDANEENEELSATSIAPLTQEVSAEWPSFRGNNYNNGVVNFALPTSADQAHLLWNLKLGTGWSAAPSTQLIVDNSLVVMSGTTIYKLDLNSGNIRAQGTMCDTFNWGYTPFAYGEGKIFVSLRAGKIQAFDATTLESLWVYTDPLGGQSVSPVVYSDGYVYTGFWNSEDRDANYVCLKAEDEDRSSTSEAKKATWSITNTGGYYWAGAVAVGDYLVFGSDDGISAESGGTSTLRCVNKYTGAVASTLALSGLGDQRSALCYAPEEGKVFFTTKGGYICSASITTSSGQLSNLSSHHVWENTASTSTPVYYKGKLYFGIGAGYDGGEQCRFVVANAQTLETVASVETAGDVKSSPLLSTAHESDGYLNFYFTCNVEPGGIYVAKVKTDCSSDADIALSEVFDAFGYEQYCISSIIASSNGTMYYKNDSCNIFAVGFANSVDPVDPKEEEDKAAAKAFEDMVDALYPITKDSQEAIDAASAAYTALTDDQRALVSDESLQKLKNAKEALAAIQEELNKREKNDETDKKSKTGDTTQASGATKTGGTTKSLGTQASAKTDAAKEDDSTKEDNDATDEVAYTASLADAPNENNAALGVANTAEQKSAFPWLGLLIGAAVLLVGCGVARLIMSFSKGASHKKNESE